MHVNATNIRFNSKVVQVIKETTKENSPFVHATAVFGLEGFTKSLVKVVAIFSKRELDIVDSYEEGMEFLYMKSVEKEEQVSTSSY